MKTAGITILAALAMAIVPVVHAASRLRTDAPTTHPYKIILVGDSTVATNSGWGGAFCADHFSSSNVACLDLARGGRSTRSYREEGSWAIALNEMKVPGYKAIYVLIQMGHNDQSENSYRWTDETAEYPDNLRRFVKEARAGGAIPVLITPLTRRQFKNGRLVNTLASWSDQVRKVAYEMSVPLIDLNAHSALLVQKMGPVAALSLSMTPPPSKAYVSAAAEGTTLPQPPRPVYVEPRGTRSVGPHGHFILKFDYTHLGKKGAKVFSAVVAHDLAVSVPALASQILP